MEGESARFKFKARQTSLKPGKPEGLPGFKLESRTFSRVYCTRNDPE